MVAKPLCPLYKYIIKPLDRAYYPELRYKMGGSVSVESEPGKGSSFSLQFLKGKKVKG